ncbi:myoneurin-like [Penaeus japonicus]|uniref:myoneurin-like n=1 Tax=Penaeus japonicus TaxID=27405 RepID=UPI001C70E2B8|nr:myoneurin-like [Penaeus japonicus]
MVDDLLYMKQEIETVDTLFPDFKYEDIVDSRGDGLLKTKTEEGLAIAKGQTKLICEIEGELADVKEEIVEDKEEHHTDFQEDSCVDLCAVEPAEESANESLKCGKCKKKFVNHSKWKIHIGRCRTGRSFICDVCGKSFTQKAGDINKHRKIHTGQRDFACEICDKKFYIHRDLGRHGNVKGQVELS